MQLISFNNLSRVETFKIPQKKKRPRARAIDNNFEISTSSGGQFFFSYGAATRTAFPTTETKNALAPGTARRAFFKNRN